MLENRLLPYTKTCKCWKTENLLMTRVACLANNILYYAEISYDDA